MLNKIFDIIYWFVICLASLLILLVVRDDCSRDKEVNQAGGATLIPIPLFQNAPSAYFVEILDTIEQIESGGDVNVVGDGGNAVGSFQIWKIYVDDVNRILKLQHKDKYSSPLQYQYYHRKSRPLSRGMVREYLKHYATKARLGREPTLEDMARIHNGGPDGWKKESTKAYWLKVKVKI